MKHRYSGFVVLLMTVVLSSCATNGKPYSPPNFSGIWLPVADLADNWQKNSLPLTAEARKKLASFDQRKHDSTQFCLPFGTPRNTLNTAPYPVEILQKPNQITLVFDRLGDIRRIFLDGRSQPEDPIPNWMGHTIGQWENEQLNMQTIAITEESILSDSGLPHSESMQLQESLALVNKQGEEFLEYRLQLQDDQYYVKPLTATRYFRRAPHFEMGEGSGLCLLDQWRKQLEQINRNQFRQQ